MAQHYLFGRTVHREMTAAGVAEVLARARKAQLQLADVPVMDILDLLDRAGRVWARPRYDGRRIALEQLPALVGFSREMVEKGLDALSNLLSRASLTAKLRYELGLPETLDRWVWRGGYQGYMRALPLGVVVHISPGNVFLGAADSLVHGLLTKNANLLKASSADPLFPLLFAASLKSLDKTGVVARSFAVVSFPGEDPEVQSAVKAGADGIVVWGGQSAVQAWSRDVPPGVRVVPYGPRLSLAVVTLGYLERRGVREAAQRMALDVVMWEQRACGSPQALFLQMPEPGAEELVHDFLEALVEELEALAITLPQPALSRDEQIEILREREVAAFGEMVGESFARWPGHRPLRYKARGPRRAPGTRWTLIWRNQAVRLGSPLNRTLVIHPYTRFEELALAIEPHRHSLQSLGVGARAGELEQIADLVAPLGVTRITELGKMHAGKMGSPHDGSFQLGQLVRWSSIESAEERFDVGQRLETDPEKFDKAARLAELLEFAREHSPFYRGRIVPDLQEIPLLTGDDIRKNTPPVGRDLLTGPFEGAYVFASGGSTGAPKFSLYSYHEWEEVTSTLASVYEVAGLTPGDTVANLFMAGSLWASFSAASQALEKIGVVTLPIAGNTEVETIMRYLDLFKPTALLGLPSVIIQIAETAERLGLDLKIPKVLYGGEHLYREAREYMRRVLGCETIISAGYASVDGGPIGYQCLHTTGSVHHLLYRYQYLEILAPPGEVGEVVITCLERRLMPVIRYRTGDLARLLDERCPCGRKSPLFELKGRTGDVVRVGTVNIYPDNVAAALDKVPGVSHLFQVVASREGTKDRLTVRAESGAGTARLAGQAREAILARSSELAEALREGWLGQLEVELVGPGELPRVARTGKIKRIVDLR